MGLDSVQLVWDVEEEFGVEFTDAAVADIRTVGELHRLILQNAGVQPDSAEAEAYMARLVERIVTTTGVPRDRVTADARIVRDLGIN